MATVNSNGLLRIVLGGVAIGVLLGALAGVVTLYLDVSRHEIQLKMIETKLVTVPERMAVLESRLDNIQNNIFEMKAALVVLAADSRRTKDADGSD